MGGEPIKNTDYTSLGRVTEFKYGAKLSEVVMKKWGQKMAYLKNFGTGWGFIPSDDSIVFVDNHDNQRGHGGGGTILTHFESRLYKIATAFMMAWPYAFVQIMSSYHFDRSKDWQGKIHAYILIKKYIDILKNHTIVISIKFVIIVTIM